MKHQIPNSIHFSAEAATPSGSAVAAYLEPNCDAVAFMQLTQVVPNPNHVDTVSWPLVRLVGEPGHGPVPVP